MTEAYEGYALANGIKKKGLSDDDIAAAKIAATTSPERPLGRWRVMKSGKTRSPPANGNDLEAAAKYPGSEYGW